MGVSPSSPRRGIFCSIFPFKFTFIGIIEIFPLYRDYRIFPFLPRNLPLWFSTRYFCVETRSRKLPRYVCCRRGSNPSSGWWMRRFPSFGSSSTIHVNGEDSHLLRKGEFLGLEGDFPPKRGTFGSIFPFFRGKKGGTAGFAAATSSRSLETGGIRNYTSIRNYTARGLWKVICFVLWCL